jgi:hypothetical protein
MTEAEMFARLVPEDKWHPIEEATLPLGVLVLVYCENDPRSMSMSVVDFDRWFDHKNDDGTIERYPYTTFDVGTVTHWRPLPLPPTVVP